MIKKAEARRIERYLGNATPEELKELLNITISLGGIVGNDIYYSIVTGVSYELLDNVNSVPMSKQHFYRLKDKSLEKFKEYLKPKLEQSNMVD